MHVSTFRVLHISFVAAVTLGMARRRSNPNAMRVRDSVAAALIDQQERHTMKIAVINFSGNVGKSTVARHLLAPRLEDAEVIAIESINSDGMETAALRGNQFDELQDQLMTLGNAVVDIGASNAEDFVNLMQNYDGSHEDFDLFVVPTVPAMKQQVDTIATLRSLSEDIGVPATRLRVVFNMVEPRRDLEKLFAKVFEAHEGEPLRDDHATLEYSQAPRVPMELGGHRHSSNALACVDWLVQHHAIRVRRQSDAAAPHQILLKGPVSPIARREARMTYSKATAGG